MRKIYMASKQYFQTLFIVQIALLAGLFMFSAVAVFLRLSGTMAGDSNSFNHIFIFAVPALIIAGLAGGSLFYKKRVEHLRQQTTLKGKMNGYREAFMLRSFLAEGPAIFAIVAYMLTGNYIFIMLAAPVIIAFLIWLPSKNKIANELQLSTSERSVIDEPQSVIADTPKRR